MEISDFERIENSVNDCIELNELGLQESNDNILLLLDELTALQYSLLLSGSDDIKNCHLTVFCGSGGLEAHDWAESLFNIYVGYCKRKNYEYNIINYVKTDTGIQTGTLEINADYIYGWLKHEEGIHRRSRVSPYGTAGGTRQTAFSSVQVSPIDSRTNIQYNGKKKEIFIDERDITWEAFRGTGPGGQHKLGTVLYEIYHNIYNIDNTETPPIHV